MLDKIKKIKNNSTIRNGALFTFFSFLNNGIGFLLLLVLAKYIMPDEYGKLNLFNTFITLVSIFIGLCTTSYISVSFFKKDRKSVRKIINIAILTSTAMLITFSGVIFLFSDFFEKIIGIEFRYLWMALFICYCQIFNTINLDMWQLEEKPIKYGFYSMSVVILNFIFTLFLVIALHLGWLGRIYSQFYVAIIFFLISIVFLIRRNYIIFKWPERSLFKETFIYALPIIPHLSSFWLRQGLDRYIINYYHTAEAVGLFSFALNFASIINIVGTAYNATNSVFIYKKLAEGYSVAKSILERQTRLMTLFFFILTILVVIAVATLIPWIVPKYVSCIPFLLPVCLAAFFQCLYLLYVNYLFYYHQTVKLMYITFSTSLLQVILSFFFTRYSVLLTAYIGLVVSLVTFLLVYIYSKKILFIKNN